jgi:hypothetical protein
MKIDGVECFGMIPTDVTFLVVAASAWPASPKVRGFCIVIFDRKARVREDFESGMLIFANPKRVENGT